jgi:23S rRNA (cytosine1962-C5)-methyltransferase
MTTGDGYELIDSGDGEKLERFASVVLRRPSPQALWVKQLPTSSWEAADARFERSEKGGGTWHSNTSLPESWNCTISAIEFRLASTTFGHVGVFPEQRSFWEWVRGSCRRAAESRDRSLRVLNLFAYTGGSSLAAAQGGAEVTHCDASKGIVRWASDNAEACDIGEGSIRWIIDDAMKFLAREHRRESRYDAIILDPPSFGRGPKGEVWKLEESIGDLLAACAGVLSDEPAFVLLSAHTPGLGPLAFHVLLRQALQSHSVVSRTPDHWAHGEMFLEGGSGVCPLPSGSWATWSEGQAPSVIAEFDR